MRRAWIPILLLLAPSVLIVFMNIGSAIELTKIIREYGFADWDFYGFTLIPVFVLGLGIILLILETTLSVLHKKPRNLQGFNAIVLSLGLNLGIWLTYSFWNWGGSL